MDGGILGVAASRSQPESDGRGLSRSAVKPNYMSLPGPVQFPSGPVFFGQGEHFGQPDDLILLGEGEHLAHL